MGMGILGKSFSPHGSWSGSESVLSQCPSPDPMFLDKPPDTIPSPPSPDSTSLDITPLLILLLPLIPYLNPQTLLLPLRHPFLPILPVE